MPFGEIDIVATPGRRVWQRVLLAAYGSLAAWILHLLIGGSAPLATWAPALLLGGAWWSAIRFLLSDTRARRIWSALLGVSAAVVVAFGANPVGLYLAAVISGFFLLLRKYRPYRLFSGPQRARIFFLGLLTLILLVLDWHLPNAETEELSRLHGTGVHLAQWALFSLRFFWFFSLLQLFLRMRLHFLRLKPKLAVSGLFIALVPLVLVAVFAVVFTYGVVGGGRAARGKAIFDEWVAQTAAGVDLEPVPFEVSLHLSPDAPPRLPPEGAPEWLDRFVAALMPPPPGGEGEPIDPGASLDARAVPGAASDAGTRPGGARDAGTVPEGLRVTRSVEEEVAREELQELAELASWAPRDTTAIFQLDRELWLLRLRAVGTPQPRIDGYRIDEAVLDHLSRLLGCDVGIISPGNIMISGEDSTRLAARYDSLRVSIHPRGYLDRADTASVSRQLWNRRLSFGAGIVDLVYLAGNRLSRGDLLFHLDTRLTTLAGEFVRPEHRFNQAVLITLGAIAGLFVLIEILALTLGVRITAGILSAVRALHQGTERLASGDLETRITIPNEDEFGDLAASFNQMTVAVQRGREAAVEHERLARELETARSIQQRLLPAKVPEAPGFEITGVSVPSLQVGGDYFDFLSYGDGRLGIAIADVSGKGMPAALLMANLQASLQGQVIHPSTIAEVVGRVNTLLARSTDAQMFATFFYGVLDCARGTLTSTNAGHNPPVVLRANGGIEFLRCGGLLLGMLSTYDYEQETTAIDPGDVVVLYTDGVTEAEGPRGPAGAMPSDLGANAASTETIPAADAHGAGSSGELARGAAAREGRTPASSTTASGEQAGASDRLGMTGPGPGEIDEAAPMFGEERLIEALRANAHRTAVEIKEAILTAVKDFVGETPQSDDVTLVVIKRRAENGPA